jgi:hypothetical protein
MRVPHEIGTPRYVLGAPQRNYISRMLPLTHRWLIRCSRCGH